MHYPITLVQLYASGESVLVVSPSNQSLLGRSTKCDLVLNDPSVSRRHALLSVEEDGVWVTDLGSKNGTFVHDIRVAGTAATPLGSRIRFGSLEFLITGYENDGGEPDSCLDTKSGPVPGKMRVKRAESAQLSVAQLRVYRLLVDGLSEKRIASRLKISPCTVHNHIVAIYRAFGVHSRAELLVRALSGKP